MVSIYSRLLFPCWAHGQEGLDPTCHRSLYDKTQIWNILSVTFMQPVARGWIWIFRPKSLLPNLEAAMSADPTSWRKTWSISDSDMVLPWGTSYTMPTSLDRPWLKTASSWSTVFDLHALPSTWEKNAKLQARVTKPPSGADQLTGDVWVARWPWTPKWFCSPSNFLWYINVHWSLIASATGLDFTNLKDRGTRGTHTADVQEKNSMEHLDQFQCFFPCYSFPFMRES